MALSTLFLTETFNWIAPHQCVVNHKGKTDTIYSWIQVTFWEVVEHECSVGRALLRMIPPTSCHALLANGWTSNIARLPFGITAFVRGP
jgi:hypothetical protein